MLAPTFEPTVASVFAPRTTIDACGTVEGYASLFGEIDHARDMVMRGAFAETLATRGIRRIPMLFQHDPSEPVGIWLELREDHRGLFARGRLIPEVARGRELLSLLRAGAIDGLSIVSVRQRHALIRALASAGFMRWIFGRSPLSRSPCWRKRACEM
jgi:Escherichia/Staphylococcus phage prohead protease